MKKISCFFIVLFVTTASYAGKFYSNSVKECYIDTTGTNTFWFCGSQSESCSGKKVRRWMNRNWLYHGQSFTHNGGTYWCCNGDQSKSGTFVESSAWETTEVITKELENGTCNYIQRTNVCGEVSGDCTVPDTCNNGTVKRNNECVVPCSSGYAFENEASNKCVQCDITLYQGISENGTCTTCNSATEFFDKENKRCISKSELVTYTKPVMQECFACPNIDVYEDCIELFSLPAGQQKNNIEKYNEIVNDCLIKTDN